MLIGYSSNAFLIRLLLGVRVLYYGRFQGLLKGMEIVKVFGKSAHGMDEKLMLAGWGGLSYLVLFR